ncbi:MAG: hypothetical protein Q8L23_06185 [Caulobacter sp.]|nr:hypothetical protein [Caulobacter sp.]
MKPRTMLAFAPLIAGLVLAGPASASVAAVSNICDGTNTVRVVTLSLNTYEYFFQPFPGGTVVHFNGIITPTSSTKVRLFAVPPGRYRLTYKIPGTVPIGTWPPDVVVKPWAMVNGVCVFTDPLKKARPVGAPVQ